MKIFEELTKKKSKIIKGSILVVTLVGGYYITKYIKTNNTSLLEVSETVSEISDSVIENVVK